MTGTHPRHLFMARCVAQTGLLTGLVLETREEHVPEIPRDLDAETARLFRLHFARRQEAESVHFGTANAELRSLAEHVLMVDREALNGHSVREFVRARAPKLLLSYGVHKLATETLDAAPGYRWNIHGGLSPWYRGVITHFWPSYLLEPQMTGMTLHETTNDIDGGALVHQTKAPLVRGDGLHDLACRAVSAFAEELPAILHRAVIDKGITTQRQQTTGRIWRSTDWRPDHLHVVYGSFGDRIVDYALDGRFTSMVPKLFRGNLESL